MIDEDVYDDEEEEENNNIESKIYCSICHKKSFDIITRKHKKNKILNELIKSMDCTELIKKCNCKNNNEYLYSHKLCVLLQILFNYETKCEKCKTDYNIEIKKNLNKKKFIYSLLFFLFVYILHLFVFLFCMFLLFINEILKEYMKSNNINVYKHLFTCFGIIVFIINSFFLYFSIINNIKQFKIYIYNYIIDIFDAEKGNIKNSNKKMELNKRINEFQEWAHLQTMNYLINDINNKYRFNKIYISQTNEIKEIIDDNNKDMVDNINKINIINIGNNIDDNQNNNIFNNIYTNKNNPNFLHINNLFKKNLEEINFSSNQSSKINNDNNENENSNNNIILHNNTNNFIRKKAKKPVHSSLKLNHTLNDYINININPTTSKNINININFSNEKISQAEHFSSSKEITLRSGRAFRRNSNIGKTALIPKKLMMTNLIVDQNIFKRKKRLLKSIKIGRNQLNLKNTQISRNIDEEIDFSSIEEIRSGFSKVFRGSSTESKIFSPKAESKFSNLKTKKSFKDVPLNVSNSIEEADPSQEQNAKNSNRSNNSNKKVHFAG